MKQIVLAMMAMVLVSTQTATAQKVRNIYTEAQTLKVEQVQDTDNPVQVNRYLFAGYNSLCLPMTLNAQQLQAAAQGVRVERLAAIRQEGTTLRLYFVDCTSEGIEAGVPYLIFSPTFQTLHANTMESQGINTELKSVCKTDGKGNTVTFGSSWEMLMVEGRYGIPAKQDVDILQSVLIRTEGDKAFLPTRCGFTWDQQASTASALEIKHVTSLEDVETSIEKLEKTGTTVDVYNAQGTLVLSRTSISAAKKSLPQGIYVVKGQKFAVK